MARNAVASIDETLGSECRTDRRQPREKSKTLVSGAVPGGHHHSPPPVDRERGAAVAVRDPGLLTIGVFFLPGAILALIVPVCLPVRAPAPAP